MHPNMRQDVVRNQRAQAVCKIVPHAVDDPQRGSGNAPRCIPAAVWRQQGIVTSVEDQRGRCDVGENSWPLGVRNDGSQLPNHSPRLVTPSHRGFELSAGGFPCCRISGARDHLNQIGEVFNQFVMAARDGLQQFAGQCS